MFCKMGDGNYCPILEHNYCTIAKKHPDEIKITGLLCSYCRNEVTDQASFMKTRMDADSQPLILCRDCHVAKFLCGNNKRTGKEEGRKKNDSVRSYKRNNEGKSTASKKKTEMNGDSFNTKISWDEDIFVSPKEEPQSEVPTEESVITKNGEGTVVSGKDIKSRECLLVVSMSEEGKDCPPHIPGRYLIMRHKKYYSVDLCGELESVRMSCHPNCRLRLEGKHFNANLVSTCTIKQGDEIVLPFSAEMSPAEGKCVYCAGLCRKNGRVKKREDTTLNREDRKMQSYIEYIEQLENKEAGTKARKTGVRKKHKPINGPSPIDYACVRSGLMTLIEASDWVEREEMMSAARGLCLLKSVLSTLVRVTPSTESVGQCFSDISDDNSPIVEPIMNNVHDFAVKRELPES